jgi:7,8-dihydro-6-hydroxymethylpterin dimethyltransferase
MTLTLTSEELLKRTTSRCPVCHAACPAEVWRVSGTPAKVFLKRTCVEHGEFSSCIASDARFYWLAKGDPNNACCGSNSAASSSCCSANGELAGTLGRNAAGHGDAPFEKLSTCLALIEIVRSCNLSCPTCYADSPVGTGSKVDAVPLAELQERIQGVIDRKGKIEILQLSGGEPTLHPQFFELLEWAHQNSGIDYLLLNTNGVRLANDAEFTRQLGELFARGGLQVYLQFDGVQENGQRWLRGADLRKLRERAIAQCGESNIPITLAMTVTPENVPHIWEAIAFGLAHPHVHGITFQPMFGSGRVPSSRSSRREEAHSESPTDDQSLLTSAATRERLNTADILLAAVEQSTGQLRFEDFTPLPCGDPNCATIGYLIRYGGRTYSISDFVDFSRLQGFLKDKVHYTLEDLVQCGCENQPLGALLKEMELKSSMAFRIMVKPFMDAWTWDQDRIDRCCTHVIRPDGKLDSFCRYYSGFSDALKAP